MEIETLKKIGDWQGRCYRCSEEGFICQDPSVPEIHGSWKIFLKDYKSELDKTRFRVDKCPLRTSLLKPIQSVEKIPEKAA